METKEIKIEVPEGYEIDKENSSFEKIIFKKKTKKYPESWDECKYKLSIGFETQFNTDKFISNLMEKTSAYTKLLCLYQEWIDIWSEDNTWKNKKVGYSVRPDVNGLLFVTHALETCPLKFPDRELAINFVNCFRDLLEKAKGLY